MRQGAGEAPGLAGSFLHGKAQRAKANSARLHCSLPSPASSDVPTPALPSPAKLNKKPVKEFSEGWCRFSTVLGSSVLPCPGTHRRREALGEEHDWPSWDEALAAGADELESYVAEVGGESVQALQSAEDAGARSALHGNATFDQSLDVAGWAVDGEGAAEEFPGGHVHSAATVDPCGPAGSDDFEDAEGGAGGVGEGEEEAAAPEGCEEEGEEELASPEECEEEGVDDEGGAGGVGEGEEEPAAPWDCEEEGEEEPASPEDCEEEGVDDEWLLNQFHAALGGR